MRRALRYWPRRRHVLVGSGAKRVWILFAGTYGDFVQILPMLHEAARLWPKATLKLYAPKRYYEAFGFALPPRMRRGRRMDWLIGLIHPADLLLMNAVCVYRLRYELLSLRIARAAAGFRYADEPFRAGLGWSVALTPEVVNFAEINHKLPMAVAASKLPSNQPLPWRARIDPNEAFPFLGPVLFSVGSAGFKAAVGIGEYKRIIDKAVEMLGSTQVTFVAGPEDNDVVAHLVEAHPTRACWRLSLEDLAERLSEWPGCILGFNSFLAHFALYLGRRMVVLHAGAIPHGYDCAPFHRQLILPWDGMRGGGQLDLQPLHDFILEARHGLVAPCEKNGAEEKTIETKVIEKNATGMNETQKRKRQDLPDEDKGGKFLP